MENFLRKIRQLIIRIIDFFYQPFDGYIPLETFRYAATGGFNTVLDIFLYFVFYNFILDRKIVDLYFISISPHIAAFLIVFPITFTTGFLLAKYITFTSSEIRGRTQLIRYMAAVSGSIFLNYVFLKFFVEYVGWWPTLSKILTTGIVVIYSYFTQKFYTFKTAGLAAQWPDTKEPYLTLLIFLLLILGDRPTPEVNFIYLRRCNWWCQFWHKGNPVKVRSCTRSCKLCRIFALHATVRCLLDGKAAKIEWARRPAVTNTIFKAFGRKSLE